MVVCGKCVGTCSQASETQYSTVHSQMRVPAHVITRVIPLLPASTKSGRLPGIVEEYNMSVKQVKRFWRKPVRL